MGGFPSGQRGQTVNLLAMPSKVRILLRPRFLFKHIWMTRGGAVWKLAGLITRRSQVQILPPLLKEVWQMPIRQAEPAGCTMICKCKSSGVQLNTVFCAQVPNALFSRPQKWLALTPFFAQIAQLVEQRTENPRVAGSIPALGTQRSHYEVSFLFLCWQR